MVVSLPSPSIARADRQKIKMISRSLDDHLPSSTEAPHPIQRNLAPHLHPFDKPREYTRALTAAKLDRMFAKPFVDALGGHQDGVYCLGKDPRRVSVVAGGGGDGEVIVHSLTMRRPLLKIPNAHRGIVGGLCWTSEARDGKRGLITAGKLDGAIKVWRSDAFAPGIRDKEVFDGNEFGNGEGSSSQTPLDQAGAIGEDGFEFDDEEGGGLNIDSAKRDAMGKSLEPTMSYTSKNGFNGIDHHRTDGIFATASNTVQIWDETRSSPMSTLAFGSSMETVSGVKFNQSETSVLASIGNDRTMCLYDIRTGKAERRIMMQVSLRSSFNRKRADGSSVRIVCHGVLPCRLYCYWVQKIIICIHSIFVIWNHLIRFTKVTSGVSWVVTGVSLFEFS
jgi:WD repeat and SOF domain-containing protein 1